MYLPFSFNDHHLEEENVPRNSRDFRHYYFYYVKITIKIFVIYSKKKKLNTLLYTFFNKKKKFPFRRRYYNFKLQLYNKLNYLVC